MSTLTYSINAAVPLWVTNGFSSEHGIVHDLIQETLDNFRKANSISAPISDIKNELESIYSECSEPNWDGYGARAISRETIEIAEEFIESFMFLDLPTPDIIPEPSGDIGFEWMKPAKHSLILSIDRRGEITYVGFFGANRAKGVERFTEGVPDVVIQLIKRLYS